MSNTDYIPPERVELLRLLGEKERRKISNKIWSYYPDAGPLRRELYHKHMEFFRAGVYHRERLMLAANRIGKTEGVGGYETVLHLTGEYPSWWEGYRFNRSINAWACGDIAKTVRDILQAKLLGPVGKFGTGLIPRRCIHKTSTKYGLADAIELVHVKHIGGGLSTLNFKSYDQGYKAFQGTEMDLIWYDEEPPMNVYVEGLMRTMTTDGRVMCTFTPLEGLSDVVVYFLPGGKLDN
jgi:phage terminase large subunit-like protein